MTIPPWLSQEVASSTGESPWKGPVSGRPHGWFVFNWKSWQGQWRKRSSHLGWTVVDGWFGLIGLIGLIGFVDLRLFCIGLGMKPSCKKGEDFYFWCHQARPHIAAKPPPVSPSKLGFKMSTKADTNCWRFPFFFPEQQLHLIKSYKKHQKTTRLFWSCYVMFCKWFAQWSLEGLILWLSGSPLAAGFWDQVDDLRIPQLWPQEYQLSESKRLRATFLLVATKDPDSVHNYWGSSLASQLIRRKCKSSVGLCFINCSSYSIAKSQNLS